MLRTLLGLVGALVGGALGEAKEYVARFADGTRAVDAQVVDWHDNQARTTLAGKPLFDPANPVRWLRDTTADPAPSPAMYVEFYGGDLLPGEVVDVHHQTGPWDTQGECLLVRAHVSWNAQVQPSRLLMRVLPGWVKRIVWQPQTNHRYQAGTLFYRDGRRVAFRSAHLMPGKVRLLRDRGIEEVPLRDVAEIHMPRADFWDRYFRQLNVLASSLEGRLVYLETSQGLRVTTSTQRFRAGGSPGRPQDWTQVVQPAWSLDSLNLRFEDIACWRFFAPHEVLLSAPDFVEHVQRSLLEGGWQPQRDRNVVGGHLAAGGEQYGWGWGVHAHCELRFELPAGARRFETRVGLDQQAGGGCVVARVVGCARGEKLDAGRVLYESPVLAGPAAEVQRAEADLASLPSPVDLYLVMDAAHANRPPGADPLDVRDHADWLEPLVTLDPAWLRREVWRRAAEMVDAWAGFSRDEMPPAPVVLVSRWDDLDPTEPHYRLDVVPRHPFLAVTRRVQVSPASRWLIVSASRHNEADPSLLHVLVNDRLVARYDVPARTSRADPPPLHVPLDEWLSQQVQVSIVHLPGGPKAAVHWRLMMLHRGLADHLVLYDEQPNRPAVAHPGRLTVSEEESFAGGRALRVETGEEDDPRWTNLAVPVRGQPRLGEFRFLRFAWKKQAGQQIALELKVRRNVAQAQRPVEQTLRLAAGPANPATDAAQQVLRVNTQPPGEWTVVTRDLHADLGNCELMEIALISPDGEAAWFDGVALARHVNDFEGVVVQTNDAAQRQRWAETFAPGFQIGDSGAGGAALVLEHLGRTHVLRTHPHSPDSPAVLTRTLRLPAGASPRLRLTVGRDVRGGGDWRLRVRGGEMLLHEQVVGPETAPEGWTRVEVDLAPLAGRETLLRIENAAEGNDYEYAYWQRVEVVDPPMPEDGVR